MKYLILDTNIYLHYLDFEQINWSELFSDEVCIVIPPKIITEIDEIKDKENSSKKKKKAKTVSSKISEYLLDGKQGKLEVITCKNPTEEQFKGGDFNINVNDDWIILSALRLQQENSTDVVIVSADNNILIKAKQNNIHYYKITEKHKLKEEPTEEENEILKLRKKLDRYENRQSEPVIVFENQETILHLQRPTIENLEDIVSQKLIEETLKCPYDKTYENVDYLSGATTNMMSSLFNTLSAEQANRYNGDLDTYLKEYEEYIYFIEKYNLLSKYLFNLKLFLGNGGSMPTGNMIIFIQFPTDLTLYNKYNLKERVFERPIKPEKGLYLGSSFNREIQKSVTLNRKIGIGHDDRERNSYWDLSKMAKNDYKISFNNLQHNLQTLIDLNDIYFDLRTVKNFSIKYTIHDSHLIDPIKDKLNVIIE